MPEPNINLLNISEESFDDLFYYVLGNLINLNKNTTNYTFYIVSPIRNLDLNNSRLQMYNHETTNMYDYYDTFYDEFYDYKWIIGLIMQCKAYPQDYVNGYSLTGKKLKFDNLNYDMHQIIELVLYEFSKHMLRL